MAVITVFGRLFALAHRATQPSLLTRPVNEYQYAANVNVKVKFSDGISAEMFDTRY